MGRIITFLLLFLGMIGSAWAYPSASYNSSDTQTRPKSIYAIIAPDGKGIKIAACDGDQIQYTFTQKVHLSSQILHNKSFHRLISSIDTKDLKVDISILLRRNPDGRTSYNICTRWIPGNTLSSGQTMPPPVSVDGSFTTNKATLILPSSSCRYFVKLGLIKLPQILTLHEQTITIDRSDENN